MLLHLFADVRRYRMSRALNLNVHLARDAETGRWYIAESDIPGLWLEAPTASALMDRVALAAPEMIELNRQEILARFGGTATTARPNVVPVFDSPLDLAA